MNKSVVFDLDGTLLNTLLDLADSTNYALRSFGFRERSPEEIRKFVGNGAKLLIERCIPEQQDSAAALYQPGGPRPRHWQEYH